MPTESLWRLYAIKTRKRKEGNGPLLVMVIHHLGICTLDIHLEFDSVHVPLEMVHEPPFGTHDGGILYSVAQAVGSPTKSI